MNCVSDGSGIPRFFIGDTADSTPERPKNKSTLHHSTHYTYLQSVDYRYTIRGQLASINNSTLANDDSNDDSNDVFGMNLIYEYSDAGIGNTGKYNGLVTAIKWKANAPGVASTSNERSYKFSYDRLMRLNAANYADRSGSSSWGNAGAYDEKGITYDLGGNILTMQRRAVISGSATDVDNLSYSYDGNRLDNVSDGSGGSYAAFGFKNLTGSGTAYTYDVNGNMATDAKKGLSLDYNVLNRTERITITTATGRYIDYTYASDGSLIRKKTYAGGVVQKTTDYIGGFTYEDGTLVYFAMAEGRVRNASGTLTNEYIIRDQQGNARISFEDNAGSVLVRQENSYYPFGLSMPGNTVPTAANKRLYNGGSEWQDDFADLPDLQQTFYRNYDPALGRFVAVDPIAEASEDMTTYQYAVNNPVMFNDPLGDKAGGGAEGYDYGWKSYRTGSGSGNAWSDGIDRDDWNAYDGSASYKRELATGSWDINGQLYGVEDRREMYEYKKMKEKAENWSRNFRQYLVLVIGESKGEDAAPIGSVILNRMMLKNVTFDDNNWLYKISVHHKGKDADWDIYRSFNAYQHGDWNVLMNMEEGKFMRPDAKWGVRLGLALDAYNASLEDIDFSNGAYFWNATSQKYAADIGDNFRNVNKGIFQVIMEVGPTTFMKYTDPKKNWP